MKHIFHVLNHLSFYMALSVQEYLSLDPKKVYFITAYRHNQNIDPFERTSDEHIKYIPISTLPHSLSVVTRLFKYSSLKKYIHSTKLVPKDEDFIFYTCNIDRNLYQTIGTLKNCIEVRVFEEGSFSYDRRQIGHYKHAGIYYKGSPLRRILRPYGKSLGHFWRYAFMLFPLKSMTQVQAYSIHEKAFPNKVFSNQVIPFYCDKTVEINVPEGASIFFNSSFFEQNVFDDPEEYKKILKKALLKIPAAELYIKFHHFNLKKYRDLLCETLEETDKKYIIIPDNVSPEQIFLQRKKLKVYSIFSSALMYARFLDAGEAYLFFDMFKHLFKKRQNLIEKMRGFYKEANIHFLNENSTIEETSKI